MSGTLLVSSRLYDRFPRHARSSRDARPIRCNVPGSFAWGVIHQRHPAIIATSRSSLPPDRQGLADLSRITDGTISRADEP